MKSAVAYLETENYSKNEYGVVERSANLIKVYVGVDSVTGKEWFEGGRNGLNPQYRFTIFTGDYHAEKFIYYNDVRYTIYRVYNKSNDETELYVEYRKGTS